jgi:hypothetical protein
VAAFVFLRASDSDALFVRDVGNAQAVVLAIGATPPENWSPMQADPRFAIRSMLPQFRPAVDRPDRCYTCRYFGERVDVGVWCARPVASMCDRRPSAVAMIDPTPSTTPILGDASDTSIEHGVATRRKWRR